LMETRYGMLGVIVAALTLGGCLLVDLYRERRRAGSGKGPDSRAAGCGGVRKNEPKGASGISERGGWRLPPGVFLDRFHSWAFVEQGGLARVGIDDFAQWVIGEIEDYEFETPGTRIGKGQRFVKVRGKKRAIALASPVTGTIELVNYDLANNPGQLKVDPYKRGWIYKVKPSYLTEEIKNMFVGEAARSWLNQETQRLREFIARVSPRTSLVGETCQDGGLPAAGLAQLLGEEEWNQFHKAFFG